MNPWVRRLHLLLTIGGGFAGVMVTAGYLFYGKGSGLEYYLLNFLFLAMFAYGIFAGLRLVDHPEKLKHLAAFYWLQVPRLAGPLLIYNFASGFRLSLDVSLRRESFFFYLGSNWQFGLFQDTPWLFGLNFFALGMALLVHRQIKRIRTAATMEPPPLAEPPHMGT